MLVIQRPTVNPMADADGNRQQFSIEPLEPGFGHTLGNSLRRTLLSSIPGAAITQVTLDDALQGTPGRMVFLRDVRRRPIWINPDTYAPPRDGSDRTLTIDMVIQEFAEQRLEAATLDPFALSAPFDRAPARLSALSCRSARFCACCILTAAWSLSAPASAAGVTLCVTGAPDCIFMPGTRSDDMMRG